jgi:hypothetical protein
LYPGLVGSVSPTFSQDISVSTNFFFCTRTANAIQPPTCASDCTSTQTTNGCNVPVESATACNGVACSTSHIPRPACVAGQCVGACASDWADCNGDKSIDGCETNIGTDPYNCGGCGVTCPQINSGATCVNGVCQLQCLPGFANCNGDLTDGCETNTTSSVSNCGTCGRSCPLLGFATPQCVNGQCAGNCLPFQFADCNGQASDGCETPVSTNPNQCGNCTIVCSSTNVATRVCTAGRCTPACSSGYADCNSGSANDGCEANVANDVNNCGSCGTVCSNNHISPLCAAGQCSGICNAGFLDCNNNKAFDGCEVNPATDANNCGSCNAPCSLNNINVGAGGVCSAGSCNGQCMAGFGDCDTDRRGNGCESSLSSDVLNCGSCGLTCTPKPHISTPTCTNSTCGGACDPGWLSCNSTKAIGCLSALGYAYTPTAPISSTYYSNTTTAVTITSNVATISLPFAFQFYETNWATPTFIVTDTGALFLNSTTAAPMVSFNAATTCAINDRVGIFPYFGTTSTTYTVTTGLFGAAPSRVFVVRWAAAPADFTVAFEEATQAIEFGYSFTSGTALNATTNLVGMTDFLFKPTIVAPGCGSTSYASLLPATAQSTANFIRFAPTSSQDSAAKHSVLGISASASIVTVPTAVPGTAISFNTLGVAFVSLPFTLTSPAGLVYNSLTVTDKGSVVLGDAGNVTTSTINCPLSAALGGEAVLGYFGSVTFTARLNTTNTDATVVFTSGTDRFSVSMSTSALRSVQIEYYTGTALSPSGTLAIGFQSYYSSIRFALAPNGCYTSGYPTLSAAKYVVSGLPYVCQV